jgi:uncharacterized protein YgiM (DUF1202 family)
MTFKIKTFCLRSSFAILLLLPGLLAALPARQLTVVQEKAPMFKEPSISSPIIKYLEKGSQLNLLAAEDSFYLVSYGGYEGWVIPYSVYGEIPGLESRDSSRAENRSDSSLSNAVQETASGLYLVVINTFANVREGPGLGYKIVGRAYRGDHLEKFIKRGNWYRVRLPNSKIGFVREDLVRDTGPGTIKQSGSPPLPEKVSEQTGVKENLSLEDKVDRLERKVADLQRALSEQNEKINALTAQVQFWNRNANSSAGSGESQLYNSPAAGFQSQGIQRPIIGNKATKVYHLPGTVFYDKIPEEFRVYFYTEEQARKAGYTKSIK